MIEFLYRLKNLKIKRSIRFFFQRLFRKFDDSETWSLEHELAKHILPRLKRFKELNNGYPNGFTPESWDIMLDEMIYAFDFRACETAFQLDATEKEHERVQRGLSAFGRHFTKLWW